MELFGIGLLIVIGIIGYFQINKGKSNQLVVGEFLPEWRIVLIEKVAFYNGLSAEDKTWFESDILHFLSHVQTVQTTGQKEESFLHTEETSVRQFFQSSKK